MSQPYDIAVIGLGAVGSFTLLSCARAGMRAVGLDRHPPGHDRGSSHGHSRIFRHAYFEHPDYVPLLRAATSGFEQLEVEAGASLLHRCGVLLIGEPDSPVLTGSAGAAERWGVPVQALTAAEVERRWPVFRLAAGQRALLEPGAGLVRPEAAIRAAVSRAQALGAEVREEAVHGWEEQASGVRIRTGQGELGARTVVIAAGAWTPVLVPALAPLLTVTRQVQGWVHPTTAPGPFPAWLVDRPGQHHLYGIPADPLAGDGRCKVAVHGSDQVTTADALDRAVQPHDGIALRQALDQHLPGLRGPVGSAAACMYTTTPDEHFIVDRASGCQHTWVAAGLSGHGFKLAPALGQALGELAATGETSLPVGFLGLGRFTRRRE